jgi:hypothetical protein
VSRVSESAFSATPLKEFVKMACQPGFTLKILHESIGSLLTLGHRLLAAILIMGSTFCLFSLVVFNILRQPELLLHNQAFLFNYASSSSETSKVLSPIHPGEVTRIKPKDPNWDGALAGVSLGFTLGQNIPLVGMFIGPVFGGFLGYEMDSRI